MKKYLCVVEIANKKVHGWFGTSEFTNEAITDLAKTAIGKLILDEFDKDKVVGTVKSAVNLDGYLIIIADIEKDIIVKLDKTRIIPGFIINETWSDKPSQHHIISKAISNNYGLTDEPLPTYLPDMVLLEARDDLYNDCHFHTNMKITTKRCI